MTELLTLSFRHRPSAAAYIARALHPWAGLVRSVEFSRLRASWTGHRIEPRQLAGCNRRTGLSPEQGGILYPQVFAFRLQMAILTHPARPPPIWNALRGPRRLDDAPRREMAIRRSQRLDVWIKGPVYYGSAAKLRAANDADGTRFALHLAGDDRPGAARALERKRRRGAATVSGTIRWLRISYRAGAILDFLAALSMLVPELSAFSNKLPDFRPGLDYRYATGMGAPIEEATC